jgi:phytanoyl-CoA hydroxylase
MASFDLPASPTGTRPRSPAFGPRALPIVDRVLVPDRMAALRDWFPKLFAEPFGTGIYPDEW